MYEYFRKNPCMIEFQMASMAIDGKNNVFEQQFHSGLHYINRKGTENIVLIGMINPLHEFMVALQLVVSG